MRVKTIFLTLIFLALSTFGIESLGFANDGAEKQTWTDVLSPNDLAVLFPIEKQTLTIEEHLACGATELSWQESKDKPLTSVFDRSHFDALFRSSTGFIKLTGDSAIDDQIKANYLQGTCINPYIPEQLNDMADSEVIALGANLAMVRGLDKRICEYSNWKIVGFRFEPCANSTEVDGYAEQDGFPEACIAQARLIAQPVVYGAEGTVDILDDAMHLVYRSRGPQEDLRKLAKLKSLISESTDLSETVDGTAQSKLQVNPWLSQEQEGCYAGFSAFGSDESRIKRLVLEGYRDLFADLTQMENLEKVTWMFSSRGSGQWSFGQMFFDAIDKAVHNGPSLAVEPGTGPALPTNSDTELENIESFSLSSFRVALDRSVHHVADWFENDYLITSELTQSQMPGINLILNPELILQAGGQHDRKSNCMSCHVAQQIKEDAYGYYGEEEVASTVNAYGIGTLDFDTRLMTPRAFDNLRNFGYGPSARPTVAERTMNEIDLLMKQLGNKLTR